MERLMASLYYSQRVLVDSHEPIIRKLEGEEDGSVIAIELPLDGDDEDSICELCLTESEVNEMYDVLFNR